ncbi:MAG TPA: DHA2 family efflux MFS transporter permease subunit [Xanthobacteraceae bacterium]
MSHSVEPKAQTKAQVWVLALTSVASLMIALDVLVVSTALDQIGKDFAAPVEALGWTVNAYILSFAVLLMTAAAAGDRYGRRRMFVVGLLVFTAASAGCALASTVEWLIAARAVQGVGAAILMPMALAQVTAAYPPEQRSWALGVYSSVTALSSVLGPVVGGAITYGLAWQWIFWLNVPIGVVAAFLAFNRLPEAFGPPARADAVGLGLVTAAVLCLVLGMVRGNDIGWANAQTISFMAAGAACAVLFVVWERRCAEPMIPMGLFKIAPFAAGNAAMFLLNGAVMSAIFFMAQFQQVVLKQDALDAGLRLLPWGIALFITAPKAGALAERFGESLTVVIGLSLQGSGLAWLAVIAEPHVTYGAMVVPMIAAGAGFAMAIPIVQKSVVGAVAVSQIGKASGVLSMIRQLGGAFGVAISVAAFAWLGGRASAQDFSKGFAAAGATASLLSFAGAIAGVWLSARQAGESR